MRKIVDRPCSVSIDEINETKLVIVQHKGDPIGFACTTSAGSWYIRREARPVYTDIASYNSFEELFQFNFGHLDFYLIDKKE